MPQQTPQDETTGDVVVEVMRTGGIAGMRRRWVVEPDPDDAPDWVLLIESCPWDAPEPDARTGADRFIWGIHARVLHQEHRRQLPESELDGPWRDLVDAVRDANTPAAGTGGQ